MEPLTKIVAVYTDSVKQVDHHIGIYLSNGTIYLVPLEKMPFLFLENVTQKQRADFRFIDDGQTIEWTSLKHTLTMKAILEVGKKGQHNWGPDGDKNE